MSRLAVQASADTGGPMEPTTSCKVAVVGAGAAGLVAGRELLREGHIVDIFEQGSMVGGVWVYDPRAESDLLGIQPGRKRVHGSLYASLRTNLPREIMGYSDYPFLPQEGGDPRRFPGHAEVLHYLTAFAKDHDLLPHIRFGTRVTSVAPIDPPATSERPDCEDQSADRPRVTWHVRAEAIAAAPSEGASGEVTAVDEEYDAVMVCNGHYAEPRLAKIPGLDAWPLTQMHSHNYREPEPFRDQVVVLLGAGPSGEDIAHDLATVCTRVLLCSKDMQEPQRRDSPPTNLERWPIPEEVRSTGEVVFPEGSCVMADAIMHCTGYLYSFPFLDLGDDTCGVVDNRVGPLYQHVVCPAFGPTLAFIGLPFKVAPFLLMELQSRWVARLLSGACRLPSGEEMLRSADSLYSSIRERGLPLRHTHNLGKTQFEYGAWLAEQCGCARPEPWREEIYVTNQANRSIRGAAYRDDWDDDLLYKEVLEALKALML